MKKHRIMFSERGKGARSCSMSKIEIHTSDEKAFDLSREELREIRQLRRQTTSSNLLLHTSKEHFSSLLSPEAQLAIQQVSDDQVLNSEEADTASPSASPDLPEIKVIQAWNEPDQSVPDTLDQIRTYSAIYDRKGPTRLPNDITEVGEDIIPPHSATRYSLDGTKLSNAMEMVEIVNRDKMPTKGHDDDVIEMMAKRNSVEKCLVWMEACGLADEFKTLQSDNYDEDDDFY